MTTNEVDTALERDAMSAETPAKAPRRNSSAPAGGAVYGLGMVGALVYFIRAAESPQDYALAVGKAVVWPAILVYLAFRRLGG